MITKQQQQQQQHTTQKEKKRRQKHKQQPCLGMELLGFYLRLATNGEGHHWPHHIVLGFYTVEEEIQLLGLLALLYSHQQSASITEIGEEKKKKEIEIFNKERDNEDAIN